MSGLDQLLLNVSNQLPFADKNRITEAFEYSCRLHSGQYRVTGDPYIHHAIAVVDILLSMHADESSVVAALLHTLPEAPGYSLAEVEKKFGRDVASLVGAMEMLNKLKSVDQDSNVESLRKMFLAMAKDVRVVLIKLADRLHNMQTLDFQTLAMRKSIAKETMDIYVPISARMGIYSLKCNLEDLAFKYLYPRQYENLNGQLNDYKFRHGRTMGEIKKDLHELLTGHGIDAEIDGRIKNLYSIYKKLKLKSQSTLDDIYDVFAIRIIVPTKEDARGVEQTEQLYAILGYIHSRWKPLTNRFKDYIAVPKPNGYRSLHTAVFGLSPQHYHYPTEIQIRSRRMHEDAEYGIASHWIYEDTKKSGPTSQNGLHKRELRGGSSGVSGKYAGWLEALSAIQKDIGDQRDVMETLRLDVFTDRIFVITPTGHVKDLPLGATPVDFAYAVHTDVGHRCQLAKVNGSVVPLNYKLQNGEVVEITTSNKALPKLQWLSFVKTSGARNKIRAFFKGLDKDKSFHDGRELINKYLARLKKPLLDDSISLFRQYNGQKLSLKDRVSLVEDVGNGSVSVSSLMKNVFGEGAYVPNAVAGASSRPEFSGNIVFPEKRLKKILNKSDVSISGETGVPYRIAQCCKATQGQPIIGYVTRGSVVTIHSENCKLLKEAEPQRVIEASWGSAENSKRFPVRVRIMAKDRVGLIRDIADVISSFNVNILDFGHATKVDREVERQLVLEIADKRQFSDMLGKLQRLRNVLEVVQGD